MAESGMQDTQAQWHPDAVQRTYSAATKASRRALILALLFIGISAVLIFAKAPETADTRELRTFAIPFMGFELPRIPTAEVGLVLACAAAFRWLLLGVFSQRIKRLANRLRSERHQDTGDLMNLAELGDSRIAKSLIRFVSDLNVLLVVLAGPIACLWALGVQTHGAWHWWVTLGLCSAFGLGLAALASSDHEGIAVDRILD